MNRLKPWQIILPVCINTLIASLNSIIKQKGGSVATFFVFAKQQKTNLLFFLLLIFNQNILAQEVLEQWTPVKGEHYQKINQPVNDNQGMQPVVRYYFWPGSASCYQLEIALQNWQRKHPEIKLERIPLVKRPDWRLLAKAWLIAVTMEQEEFFLNKLYQSLHQLSLPINNLSDLQQFIKSLLWDEIEFTSRFNSVETNQQLKLLENDALLFPISGVPTIIINNQWLSDASMAKTSAQFIQIIEQLTSNTSTEEL